MINVRLDLSAITEIAKSLDPERVRTLGTDAVRNLSAQTHAHIIEKANSRLHSRLRPFLDGLKIQEDKDGTWLIILDKKVRYIDDGMEPHSMVEDLLSDRSGKGNVHTSKDGHRWRVIPFNHGPGKGVTSTTPAQQSLISTIRNEMKTKGIGFGKIEHDESGRPKTGLLHSFDIMGGPKKTHNGPGQGWGPVGAVRQGPTGIPFLQGVRVYQHMEKTASGGEKARRSVMTFRIVSSKMAGTGRWYHPGLPPEHFFEEASEWAKKEWETHIVPQIIAALSA